MARKIKVFELKCVMHQQEMEFIQLLSKFRKAQQSQKDIDFIKNLYLRPPPSDPTVPHRMYTNAATQNHNLKAFHDTLGQLYVFKALDTRHDTCPSHFTLSDDPHKTVGLHKILRLEPNMLVELCAGNYCIEDGLVNGAEGIFRKIT